VGFAFTHLRGVGSTAIGPGIENPVAIYVDGVYYASSSSSLFDFMDVSGVEVLKGPQGTLFGRNATGGLIQIQTLDPTQTPVVQADIGYGNYQSGKADLYLAGGITSSLAADFAAQVSGSGQGYGSNAYNGDDVYRNDLDAGFRTKWLWTPTDGTKATLGIDYTVQRNSDTPNVIFPGAGNLAFLPQPIAGASPWDIDQNVQPYFRNENGGVSLKVDQDVGFANLMNLAAYRKSITATDWDLDYSPTPYEAGILQTAENQFSEELQLSSKPGQPIRWTTGLYYFEGLAKYAPSHVPFDSEDGEALDPLAPFTALSIYSTQHTQSYSGYGQATATVLQGLDLTLGGRYTDEKHSLYGVEDFNCDVATVCAGVPSVFPAVTLDQTSQSFNKFTYRIALDYHINDDQMVYASYNTGFKSGGYNTQVITDPAFKPETLGAWELGIKSELLDRRLRVNLAGFHYSYANIQVQKIELASTGIINGAAATINGVDLDLEARVTDAFTITGTAEYLNAYFDSFPNAPISNPDPAVTAPVTIGSAAGNKLPYTAHIVFSVAANYRLLLGSSQLDWTANVEHSGSFPVEADNVLIAPAFTKLNALVKWSQAGKPFSVSLWGKNLTNVASIDYAGTLENGIRQAHYDAPRTYGITLGYLMD